MMPISLEQKGFVRIVSILIFELKIPLLSKLKTD